jgi:flagellar motor protein MotB
LIKGIYTIFVFDFLCRIEGFYELSIGIKEQRMTSKGYGSSFIIYPNAVSEEEQIKNRRVEIVITKG